MEDIILAVKEQYPQGIIVAVAILIMIWLLKKNLFEPLLAIAAKRASDKEILLHEAGSSSGELERLEEERKQGLLNVRSEVIRVKDEARAHAQEEGRVKLEETTARLTGIKEEKAKELEQEMAGARSSMKEEIPLMARQIAERVLGRSLA
jgi:F-type H+-transporting ATPase subunit b